jgi:hypothetical protein
MGGLLEEVRILMPLFGGRKICSRRNFNYDSRVIPRLKLATAKRSFIIAAIVGVLGLTSQAQSTSDVVVQPFSPAPYRVGERLTYNVSFSNFISAAHIELLVAARGTFLGREGIQLKGHVETTGIVNAALFAINNDYITYVNPSTGLPYYGQQILRVASRTSESSADFNQPAGTAAIPSKGTGEIAGAYDLLSAIYRVRALTLTEGAIYQLTIRVENATYEVEVRVRGRQVLKTNVGSFETIASQIKVRNNSEIDGYDLRVYFSDDQRHVPVLITAKHSVGEIRAELAGSEFVTTQPIPPGPNPSIPTNPSVPTTPSLPPAASPPPVTTTLPRVVAPNETASDAATLEGLPFRVGEQLNYQVFLPNIAAAAGLASFQVRARSKYSNRDGLLFTVTAQTTNAIQHLFFANDVISSYVDPKTLLPFQTDLNLIEGRRRENTKLTINQDHGAATTDKGVRIEIPVGTHDYLSFFYALRTFNLTPPKRSAVSILVNNKPKTLFINAFKRESLQLASQTIPAIQLLLTTDDPQPDKNQLRVWISDDSRRLPLRLTAVTPLGVLRADLAIIPVTTQ